MTTATFVVTTYNKAPYAADLLTSLADQPVDGGVEVVVVDDGSTDGTVDRVKELLDARRAAFRATRIFVASHNGGPSSAINFGIAMAEGRFLHFVDGDDRLPIGATKAMLAAAAAGADLVYGGRTMLDGPPTSFGDRPATVYRPAIDRVVRSKLVGMRFLASKAACMEAGGADEQVFIQDVSLPLGIAWRAQALAQFDAPVVEVRSVPGSVSSNRLQEVHDYCLAVTRFLARTQLDPGLCRILERRVWQRLMKCTALPVAARGRALARVLTLAAGLPAGREAVELAGYLGLLATSGALRRPGQRPAYHQVC